MQEGWDRGDGSMPARISADLGLSAAPVREALAVLAGRGVIDLLPDRGAVMRAMSPREVIQLWEVIGAVGALGLARAAQEIARGADPALLVARYAAITERPLAATPVQFLLRLNDWHFAAHVIGGNPFIDEMLERAGVAYWDRYLAQLIDVHANMDAYQTNYRRMHEAVLAGDGAAAAAIMHFHAAWSIRQVEIATAKPPRRRRAAARPARR